VNLANRLLLILTFATNLNSQTPQYRSKVMIHDLKSKKSVQIYEATGVIEAPNWSRDGKHLLLNTAGNLYRLPVAGGQMEQIRLEGNLRCNNDHDYSRDGKRIAFSASSPASRASQVYIANADGSDVKLLTPAAPSYFHGWSPDSKWLAFVGQRNGKYELYRVSANGGPEERLTAEGGYDDGPEYSRDGKWIYFNSNRGGDWKIWRIPAGGGAAEKLTSDDLEDWFPHVSPNGKRMLFLSFPKGTPGHNGRMPGMKLRLMSGPGKVEDLVTFFGGQGTINVNSWAPDSRRFAYVVYEPL
jgi:TolB protein